MDKEKKYTPTAIFDMLENIQFSLEVLEEKMDNIYDLVNEPQEDYGYANDDEYDGDGNIDDLDDIDDEDDWDEDEEEDEEEESDDDNEEEDDDEIQSDLDFDWDDWYDDKKKKPKKPKKLNVTPYKSIYEGTDL